MFDLVVHPTASISPAGRIDRMQGWKWVVKASSASSAITLARFHELPCALSFAHDLVTAEAEAAATRRQHPLSSRFIEATPGQ